MTSVISTVPRAAVGPVSLLLFAAALAAPAGAAAQSGAPAPAPAGRITFPGTVERYTLGNGLRVVLASDPEAAAVDVAVWYDAGTRHERPGRTGIAHLFEHLMFRGSEKLGPGEHARSVTAAGGTFGAITTADYCSFFQTVPAAALPAVLALEADRMTGLVIDERRLAATREGIKVERQLPAFLTPAVLGLQRLFAAAFPGHPYRMPLFGAEADLDKLTLADAREWYRARYGPGRAVLTVTGRFDPAETRAAIEQSFGRLRGGRTAPPARPQVDFAAPARVAHDRGRTPFPMLWAGWTLPGRGNPDLAPLLLIAATLARGDDSRLDRALVQQQGTCVFVDGDLEARGDASLLYCMLAIAPGADSAAVERELQAEVDRFAREPLPAAELEGARRRVEIALLFSLQTTRGRAVALGSSAAVLGDDNDAVRQLERHRPCPPADVQRVAARWLTGARRVTVRLAAGRPPEPRAGGAR